MITTAVHSTSYFLDVYISHLKSCSDTDPWSPSLVTITIRCSPRGHATCPGLTLRRLCLPEKLLVSVTPASCHAAVTQLSQAVTGSLDCVCAGNPSHNCAGCSPTHLCRPALLADHLWAILAALWHPLPWYLPDCWTKTWLDLSIKLRVLETSHFRQASRNRRTHFVFHSSEVMRSSLVCVPSVPCDGEIGLVSLWVVNKGSNTLLKMLSLFFLCL